MVYECFVSPGPGQSAITDRTLNLAFYNKILKESLIHDLILRYTCVMQHKTEYTFFLVSLTSQYPYWGGLPLLSEQHLFLELIPYCAAHIHLIFHVEMIASHSCWRVLSCICVKFHKSQTWYIGQKPTSQICFIAFTSGDSAVPKYTNYFPSS